MLTRKVYFCRLAALCSTDEKYKLVPAATGKDLHNNINIHARNTGKLATTLKHFFLFFFFPSLLARIIYVSYVQIHSLHTLHVQ